MNSRGLGFEHQIAIGTVRQPQLLTYLNQPRPGRERCDGPVTELEGERFGEPVDQCAETRSPPPRVAAGSGRHHESNVAEHPQVQYCPKALKLLGVLLLGDCDLIIEQLVAVLLQVDEQV